MRVNKRGSSASSIISLLILAFALAIMLYIPSSSQAFIEKAETKLVGQSLMITFLDELQYSLNLTGDLEAGSFIETRSTATTDINITYVVNSVVVDSIPAYLIDYLGVSKSKDEQVGTFKGTVILTRL